MKRSGSKSPTRIRSKVSSFDKQLQPSSPEITQYRSHAIRILKELTQAEKEKKQESPEYRTKALTEINKNIGFSMRRNPKNAQIFSDIKIMVYIRHFFVDNISKVQPLIFFKTIMISEEATNKYLALNIPLHVARILSKEDSRGNLNMINQENEVHEALKFIAEWIEKFPKTFPKFLAITLIAYAELSAIYSFEEKKKDHIPHYLKLYAIDIIMNLSVKHTKLCASSGGFNLLVNSITEPTLQDKSYDIICRIIFFLNDRRYRDQVSKFIDLRKIFSIFTDLDHVFWEQHSKNKGNIQNSSKFYTELTLAKNAIIALLKSWVGIIYLGNEKSTLHSFMEALKQIPKRMDSEVRKTIYSILEDIISIGDTLIVEARNQQHDFRVSNLINCFMTTFVDLFIENGLFKILVELSGVGDSIIAEPAQKLLKKLSIYAFNFLPNSSKYIDFLITAASKNSNQGLILKSSSNFVINKIGNYIFDRKNQSVNLLFNEIESLFGARSMFVPISRSAVSGVSKSLNILAYRQNPGYRRSLLDANPIPKQHKDNYRKWNWELLELLLEFPQVQRYQQVKPDNNQKYRESKIFKYLIRFYSHMKGSFSELKWTMDHFIYIKVGKKLIRDTMVNPQNIAFIKKAPQSQFQFTISFIYQIQKLLQNVLNSCVRHKIYQPFFKTMQRELILWIGLFSQNKVGFQQLLCQNEFFQILCSHAGREECSYVIGGILFHMNFYRGDMHIKKKDDNGGESIVVIGPLALLQSAIRKGSKRLRLICLDLIKLLFRIDLPNFAYEGFEMLLCLICTDDQEIIANAVLVIEELLKQKLCVAILLACMMDNQSTQKLNFKIYQNRLSPSILIRLISTPNGFKYINARLPGWLQEQYQKWMCPQCSQNYCLHLQALLNDSLSFIKNKSKQLCYNIESNRNLMELSFLYRLPWVLYVNSEQYPLSVRMNKKVMKLYYEFAEEEQEDDPDEEDRESLAVALGIGSMFVDYELNLTKEKTTTYLDVMSLSPATLYGSEYMTTSCNGIKAYFSLDTVPLQAQQSHKMLSRRQLKRIHIQIKLDIKQQNEQLPLHLIQQLTNTAEGRAFLSKKEILTHAKQILKEISTPLEIRSVLWSIGYYGSTREGIVNLIHQDIVAIVVELAEGCEILSIRGTCRYILNMFCHTEMGRNYLGHHGFIVNSKTLNCFPIDTKSLYKIKESKLDPSTHEIEYKPMTTSQKQLYDLIISLINSLSSKYALQQIKQLRKSYPKITHSYNLFQNVINLLTSFKYRHESRKYVLALFEDLVKSPAFNAEEGGYRLNYHLQDM